MTLSNYLARLLGPVGVIVGLGVLLNQSLYAAMVLEFFRSAGLLYLAAIAGLVAGVAIVLAHNVWTADWRVIITLVGWVSIVDSGSWILFPQTMQGFWGPLVTGNFPAVSGVVTLILALILCYYGYMASGAGRASARRASRPARRPSRRRR